MRRLLAPLLRRLARNRGDAGMTTVEYAVCLLAAAAFAGLLYKVLSSGTAQAALNAMVQRALK